MLVGLTGNFGSGKSTVLEMFKALGAITVSSDEIVHRLLSETDIKLRVRELLGDVFDSAGNIDKPKTAAIVFNNPQLRRELETIIHPLVIAEIKRKASSNTDKVVVAEIPLLFEGNFTRDVDKTITVISDIEVVEERLKNRGFSTTDIKSRLSAQIPQDRKVALSDFVIDNSGNPEETKSQVTAIYEKLTGMLEEKVVGKGLCPLP
ncbi:MAG: dephospho-CoA kinase [Nitrospirae bacterium]|nr:dephospho-CoA kinase [Nitrospirota bacterium]MBF0533556.1 dephospho-CoA kinase [Nitrospirota bacterium]MBF0615920.1 dephospho-CoA kinase [Nitrospirota bacterium]